MELVPCCCDNFWRYDNYIVALLSTARGRKWDLFGGYFFTVSVPKTLWIPQRTRHYQVYHAPET